MIRRNWRRWCSPTFWIVIGVLAAILVVAALLLIKVI
jgi:hypothetical protein